MVIYKQPLGEVIRQLSEQPMVIYEQPLNEKIRLFMRLELLVKRFQTHLMGQPSIEDTISALHLLLDLYNLSARIDLKSEVLKELERMAQTARCLMRHEDEGYSKFAEVLEDLTRQSEQLYQQQGQLGQHLKSHSFFNSLRQRMTLPGGINSFDIPLFHYWQSQPLDARLANLSDWAAPYIGVNTAASIVLNTIRQSAERREEVGKAGFFNCNIEARKPYQLIRVELPAHVEYYPEISAGKQRFSLRFMEADWLLERGKQTPHDIPFTLLLCNF
jgi:cell division protein ZapD